MATLEDIYKDKQARERRWEITANPDVVLTHLRIVIRDYREKPIGDILTKLTIFKTDNEGIYVMFVGMEEYVGYDDRGPAFAQLTPSPQKGGHDAECTIYRLGEDHSLLVISLRGNKELPVCYWERFFSALQHRLYEWELISKDVGHPKDQKWCE